MKINRLLSLLTLTAVSLIVLQSNKDGYNVISAHMPTTAGCNCHGPAVASQNNALKVEVLDANNVAQSTYIPSTNYTVRVTFAKNYANNAAGFQATLFNSSSTTQAGTPSNGTLCTADNIGGTVVVNHSTKDVTSIKVGNLVTWTFPWRSPITSASDITISVIANDANDDNTTGGDAIVYTSIPLNRIGVGVADYSKGIEAIYPNPTTAEVSLDLESAEPSTIAVYSIGGQVVKQFQAKGSKIKFDVSDIVSGNYFLTVTQDGKVARQQFSKF